MEFVEGEIEAGFVFASAAAEYRRTDPARAISCRSDAENCYSSAVGVFQQCTTTAASRSEMESDLKQLRQQLDLLRDLTLPPLAA